MLNQIWICRRAENLSENFHSCWITKKTRTITWIVKLSLFNISLFRNITFDKRKMKTFYYHDIIKGNCSLSWPVSVLTRSSFLLKMTQSWVFCSFKRLAKYFPTTTSDPSTITWPINCPLTHSLNSSKNTADYNTDDGKQKQRFLIAKHLHIFFFLRRQRIVHCDYAIPGMAMEK